MNTCVYKIKKRTAWETIWVGTCKGKITTQTGDYGMVHPPTINFCPHCGGKAEIKK